MSSFDSSRSPRFNFRLLLALAGALAALPVAGFGCSVCGCSLSSDWAQQGGAVEAAGFQSSLRYEYFEQDNLRSGYHSINSADLPASYTENNEVQQRTYSRSTWVGIDWKTGTPWAVSLQIPYIDRFHSTLDAGDTVISTANKSGIGDARITASYQLRQGNESSWSFQAGLKLPTGGFNQNFATGPDAGTLLDRGLQLGTGTTDLLAGVGYYARPEINLGWFTQVQFQQPLASRDQFLPASTVSWNNGVRYLNSSNFTPELQFNVRWDSHETNAQADYTNSGDLVALLTPGVTADITHTISAFVYVQIPVLEKVNGLQLEPRILFTTGVRWKW